MSNIIEKSRLEKLPKEIQRYIAGIEAERDTAIETLNNWVYGQNLSNIFVTDLLCLGEEKTGSSNPPSAKTFYIPSRRVTVQNKGVVVEVLVTDNGVRVDLSRDFDTITNHTQFAAMRPLGHSSFEVVLAEPKSTE